MNKLFIGKSTFYKAAIYNITPKRVNDLKPDWVVCVTCNNRRLHDYSNSFYYILNDISHLQKYLNALFPENLQAR